MEFGLLTLFTVWLFGVACGAFLMIAIDNLPKQ